MGEDKKALKRRASEPGLLPAMPETDEKSARLLVVDHSRGTMPSVSEVNADDLLIQLLLNLQGKLNAPDQLTQKVDSISGDVKEIKERLYDPDEGLYAKVRDTNDSVGKMKTEITTELATVTKWKKNVTGVLVWLGAGIGTGLLGILGKLLWSWLSGHIVFH